MEFLFLDNHIAVVDKSQNVPIDGEKGLKQQVVDALKEKGQKASYVNCVNSLDEKAGGLVLFALTSKAYDRLLTEMQNGDFLCRFFAVCVGAFDKKNDFMVESVHLNKEGHIENIPKLNADAFKISGQLRLLETQASISLMEVLAANNNAEAERFLLSLSKIPVFGDKLFKGDSLAKNTNLAFWCVDLKFVHPVLNKKMTFRMFPPVENKPWSFFNVEKYLRI